MWQIIGVCLLFAFPATSAVGCKDQNNKDVDWFVGYKMPRTNDSSLQGVGKGVAFYYMDLNMDSFAPSPNDMTSNQQAIAYTLQQYYDNKGSADSSFVLYNDEEAEEELIYLQELYEKYGRTKFSSRVQFGHNKGVVYFDKTGGFWLIHSIPKFPPVDAYGYPTSGTIYAQSILCMTLNYDELTKIGTQLYYNHPDMYASNLPTSMASDNPDLAKVIGGEFKKGSPFSSTLTLQTRGGQQFTSFAKSADFNQDLYDVLVAPSLQAPLYVETWRRGSPVPLDCSTKYIVLDAQTMKVGTTAEFKYTHDHSKLAISSSSSKPYVCIGDINRMTSQFVRGGGTVCMQLKKVWDNYSPMFLTENSC
jgi:deoxyribonuclease-2